jgi:quercetin dioxygenase-like cupin family protein
VRAGDEGPVHTHTREDESVYVLEGAITVFVGDQQIEVGAGSYGALPKGVPHGHETVGNDSAVWKMAMPLPRRAGAGSARQVFCV